LERIALQIEKVQALEHSQQRLVERIEQQSGRVQALEDAMVERRHLVEPQLLRQGYGPKSPRSLAAEIAQQREKVQAIEHAILERRRLEEQRVTRQAIEREQHRMKWSTEVSNHTELVRERRRALAIHQDELRHRDREYQDNVGMQAYLRHDSIAQARRALQRSVTDPRIVAFDGPIPSFLDQEYQYMKEASTTFPEAITPSTQMSCMKAYQKATSDASRRLPCGLCGGLFQEEEVLNISLQDTNLLHFFEKTKTEPDSCAVKDDFVSLCSICSSAVAKRAIPPLSAGNFVNCLFCQDYPAVLKNLNTVEEAFIARAHVIGMFLKLTSGAQRGISYRGSRGHCVAVRQDPSQLLRILPARRLQDHTTITVSWDRGTPPSDENLARFCSVDKGKVLRALLWLCSNNPVYRSVSIDYSVLDSWPDIHIPQEIRDAFIALGSETAFTQAPVTDEREGYATSLQGGLFENDLDAEIDDAEPGSILSRSFFSDFHGQDPQSTSATLASLHAILEDEDLGSSVRDSGSGHECGKSY